MPSASRQPAHLPNCVATAVAEVLEESALARYGISFETKGAEVLLNQVHDQVFDGGGVDLRALVRAFNGRERHLRTVKDNSLECSISYVLEIGMDEVELAWEAALEIVETRLGFRVVVITRRRSHGVRHAMVALRRSGDYLECLDHAQARTEKLGEEACHCFAVWAIVPSAAKFKDLIRLHTEEEVPLSETFRHIALEYIMNSEENKKSSTSEEKWLFKRLKRALAPLYLLDSDCDDTEVDECTAAECAAAGLPPTWGASNPTKSSPGLAKMSVSMPVPTAHLVATSPPLAGSCLCNVEIAARLMFAALKESLLVNQLPELPARAHLVEQMLDLFFLAVPDRKLEVSFTYVLDRYNDWLPDWCPLLEDCPAHEVLWGKVFPIKGGEESSGAQTVMGLADRRSPDSELLIAVVRPGGMPVIVSCVETSGPVQLLHGATCSGEPCTATFQFDVFEVYEVSVRLLTVPRPCLEMAGFWMMAWENSSAAPTLGLLSVVSLAVDALLSGRRAEVIDIKVVRGLFDALRSCPAALPVPEFLSRWNEFHLDHHHHNRCVEGRRLPLHLLPDGRIVFTAERAGCHLLGIVRVSEKDMAGSVVPMLVSPIRRGDVQAPPKLGGAGGVPLEEALRQPLQLRGARAPSPSEPRRRRLTQTWTVQILYLEQAPDNTQVWSPQDSRVAAADVLGLYALSLRR